LDALEAVAGRHNAKSADVSLAWLIQRAGVTAPIASATTPVQLESLISGAKLQLSPGDVVELDTAAGS
jgi:aryl-alcohol dehydrogenase-like predicted oxidoreductase